MSENQTIIIFLYIPTGARSFRSHGTCKNDEANKIIIAYVILHNAANCSLACIEIFASHGMAGI